MDITDLILFNILVFFKENIVKSSLSKKAKKAKKYKTFKKSKKSKIKKKWKIKKPLYLKLIRP